jgi:hypothetical protein
VRTVAHSAWKEIVAVGKLFDEEAEGLEWTVFRVGGLANGEGDAVATYIGAEGATTSVHRIGIAKWLVEQVETDDGEWVRQKPLICSKDVIKWWSLRP